jgi:Na+/proline symporter
MTGLFIALGVFIAFVLVMGIRADRRNRDLRGTGGRGSPRLENQTKADEWGGPGY